jgi:hypothetical protein
MPRKDLGCVQSVPLLLEEGDRVNAELQRAPAVSEMRQVGVPHLCGLSRINQQALNAELQLDSPLNPSRLVLLVLDQLGLSADQPNCQQAGEGGLDDEKGVFLKWDVSKKRGSLCPVAEGIAQRHSLAKAPYAYCRRVVVPWRRRNHHNDAGDTPADVVRGPKLLAHHEK